METTDNQLMELAIKHTSEHNDYNERIDKLEKELIELKEIVMHLAEQRYHSSTTGE